MTYTIYQAQFLILNLINHLERLPHQDQLETLKSCLNNLNHHFLDKNFTQPTELTRAAEYRQAALVIHHKSSLLPTQHHRAQLKSIAISLICFAQKIESLYDSDFINPLKLKIEPLINQSSSFDVTMLRPLCQQSSLYLAGHQGICSIAAKAWLADYFMNYAEPVVINSTEGGFNFIKAVEFHKEELFFLYATEKEKNNVTAQLSSRALPGISMFLHRANDRESLGKARNDEGGKPLDNNNRLTFFVVTRLLRLSTGPMLLALLDELADHKNARFLITLAHFRTRLFHAVGCKFSKELIQWFDADCGIFQTRNKEDFGKWLDFYLKQNRYDQKFSFFSVRMGERSPRIVDRLSYGIKYLGHI